LNQEKDRWLDEFNKDSSPFRKTTKTTKFLNIEKGLKNFYTAFLTISIL
jgi:hypothetical protein